MPGVRAATQSSRCGRSPKEPSRVSATMRETPVFSAKMWNGRRTFRFMSASGMGCLRFRLRFGFGFGLGLRLPLRLVNRPDHVERAFRGVFELIAQYSLAAIKRVLEADELSFESAELLGREKGLREEALQPAGACDHLAIVRRQLLEAEHGNDVFEIRVLGQRPTDLLRQVVVTFANDAGCGHLGTRLQRVDGRK